MKHLPRLTLIPALFVLGCHTLPDQGRPAAGEGAPPRAWTVDDTLDLVRIGGVAMSPDGAWVLYTESRVDWEANGYERSVFLVSSSGGSPELRADLEETSGLGFTPDGSRITYLGEHEDADQVFTVGLGGGRAKRITDHPGGVEDFAWSPDGSCVFFTAEEPREPAAQAAWDAGGDAIFVGEDGNGLEAGRWSNLWVYDLASGAEERLTDERATIGDFDVAPDGQRVVFNACSDNRTNYFWRSELFIANRANGMVVQLTENDAPEDSPKWSPDGRTIAYHSPDPEWFDLRHGYLWLMDPVTGDARQLEGQHQGELGEFEWAPDSKHILFGESRGVFANLYELDTEADTVRALTDLEGTVRARAFADDGATFAYTFGDHTSPADLFVGRISGVEPVSTMGADPERLALRGWSWGGNLGAWTITQTNRFKAASLGAMVGDWTAEIGGGLMFDLQLHYIQGLPWVDRAEWDARSALTFVTNVETPTLLLHGERDDISTVNQSQMFYTALRARDVPVRFIKFPRQGHDIDEPHLARIALVEEVRWFEQYVRSES